MATKGLGRGLNAFFDDIEEVKSVSETKKAVIDKVVELNMAEVEPMLNQPRKVFDKKKLEELANSVREHGVIQPILVVKNEDGYNIVAGERRWRAAKIVGLKTIPAIVKDYTDTKKKQVALIENIQRENLNFIEEAKAIDKLIRDYGFTQSQAALHLGMEQPTIANKLRILKLSERQIERINNFSLTERHARALLRVSDENLRISLIGEIARKGLNVEKSEKLIETRIAEGREKENLKRRSVIFGGEVKLFLNTIDKAIETMQAAGINAEMERKKGEEFIEYKIVIPYVRKG